MKTIVYAGPHYGREHKVISRSGREMTVKHHEGQPFTVCLCDTDILKPAISHSDSVHYKRVFDALLDHGFAESEEASPSQWADELIAAIEQITLDRIRRQQVGLTTGHGEAVEKAMLDKYPDLL